MSWCVITAINLLLYLVQIPRIVTHAGTHVVCAARVHVHECPYLYARAAERGAGGGLGKVGRTAGQRTFCYVSFQLDPQTDAEMRLPYVTYATDPIKAYVSSKRTQTRNTNHNITHDAFKLWQTINKVNWRC